jgi:cysteine synthase A
MALVPPGTDSILRTTGRTPLVRLERLERAGGPRLFAKCEYLGPGGSIFDRAADAIMEAAHLAGHLTAGSSLITTGGTDASVSLAMAASATGHPLTVVIPKSLHPERRRILIDYGATLHGVDDSLGFDGARHAAFDLARESGALLLDLFEGREIVRCYETVGREIVEALGHVPALVVAGLDLGAIPTGIARGLRTSHVVAVEPEAARIGSGGPFGSHLLGGLAPGPKPVALDATVISDFEPVSDQDAWQMAERVSRETGLLTGIAGGAIIDAALRRLSALPAEAEVIAVLPDSGERRFMLSGFFP